MDESELLCFCVMRGYSRQMSLGQRFPVFQACIGWSITFPSIVGESLLGQKSLHKALVSSQILLQEFDDLLTGRIFSITLLISLVVFLAITAFLRYSIKCVICPNCPYFFMSNIFEALKELRLVEDSNAFDMRSMKFFN